MKYKVLLSIGILVLGIACVCGAYLLGVSSGNNTGYVSGYDKGSFLAYDKGYALGYSNGQEFVVTHLEQYVTTPKAVKYDEVVAFLKEDKTDENKYYALSYDCVSYAKDIKNNAGMKGIKSGVVSMDLSSPLERIGHAINAFDTDRGIVYFDPQTDGQRYDVRVGGTYILQGISYRITKVDVIW
jgi:hypothetical protein